MSHKIWVDTGFLVTLFAADDKHHKGVVAFIKEHQDMEMHSIWPVIVETCFFLNNQGKDWELNNLRNYNAEFLLQIECSQEAHSYSTQRSESIQAGIKRQVRVVSYLILSPKQALLQWLSRGVMVMHDILPQDISLIENTIKNIQISTVIFLFTVLRMVVLLKGSG